MMFWKHWVRCASLLNFQCSIINFCYFGYVFFHAGVNGIHFQFLHRFTAAHNRNARIDLFGYHISAMFTNIKFCVHNFKDLRVKFCRYEVDYYQQNIQIFCIEQHCKQKGSKLWRKLMQMIT